MAEQKGRALRSEYATKRRAPDITKAIWERSVNTPAILNALAHLIRALDSAEETKAVAMELLGPVLLSPPGHQGFSRAQRDRVRRRDGHSCQFCGEIGRTEIDHIIPTALGGPNQDWNLWCLCERCNRDKGNLLIPSAIRRLRKQLGEVLGVRGTA